MTLTSVPSVPTPEQFMKLVQAEITTDGKLDMLKAHGLWREIYENMKIEANESPDGWQARQLPLLRSLIDGMESLATLTEDQ